MSSFSLQCLQPKQTINFRLQRSIRETSRKLLGEIPAAITHEDGITTLAPATTFNFVKMLLENSMIKVLLPKRINFFPFMCSQNQQSAPLTCFLRNLQKAHSLSVTLAGKYFLTILQKL